MAKSKVKVRKWPKVPVGFTKMVCDGCRTVIVVGKNSHAFKARRCLACENERRATDIP